MTTHDYLNEMLTEDGANILTLAKAILDEGRVPVYEDAALSVEDITSMLNQIDLTTETVEFVRFVLLAAMQEEGVTIEYA